MTALENVDEEKEIERLRNILRDSNADLSESNDMKNIRSFLYVQQGMFFYLFIYLFIKR